MLQTSTFNTDNRSNPAHMKTICRSRSGGGGGGWTWQQMVTAPFKHVNASKRSSQPPASRGTFNHHMMFSSDQLKQYCDEIMKSKNDLNLRENTRSTDIYIYITVSMCCYIFDTCFQRSFYSNCILNSLRWLILSTLYEKVTYMTPLSFDCIQLLSLQFILSWF